MKLRFKTEGHASLPDSERDMELPNIAEAGLTPHMFLLSEANVGATIVMTDGDYVRTWTLLEW